MFLYPPQTIDNLYLDKKDYHGLYYLYEVAKEYAKRIKLS